MLVAVVVWALGRWSAGSLVVRAVLGGLVCVCAFAVAWNVLSAENVSWSIVAFSLTTLVLVFAPSAPHAKQQPGAQQEE